MVTLLYQSGLQTSRQPQAADQYVNRTSQDDVWV